MVYLLVYHVVFILFVWAYWQTIFTKPMNPLKEVSVSDCVTQCGRLGWWSRVKGSEDVGYSFPVWWNAAFRLIILFQWKCLEQHSNGSVPDHSTSAQRGERMQTSQDRKDTFAFSFPLRPCTHACRQWSACKLCFMRYDGCTTWGFRDYNKSHIVCVCGAVCYHHIICFKYSIVDRLSGWK